VSRSCHSEASLKGVAEKPRGSKRVALRIDSDHNGAMQMPRHRESDRSFVVAGDSECEAFDTVEILQRRSQSELASE
jgi:hypothetical protein